MTSAFILSLKAFLETQSGIGSIIPGGHLPDENDLVYPAITYKIDYGEGIEHKVDGRRELHRPDVVFKIHDPDYLTCRQVFDSMMDALDGKRGPMGTVVCWVTIVRNDGRDDYDQRLGLYIIEVPVNFWYKVG